VCFSKAGGAASFMVVVDSVHFEGGRWRVLHGSGR
jgi:hypothetical protein